MANRSHSSRYARFTAAFAASAFALLTMVSLQLHEANTVAAEVTRRPTVMTNYRSSAPCLARTSRTQRTTAGNYRLCRSK